MRETPLPTPRELPESGPESGEDEACDISTVSSPRFCGRVVVVGSGISGASAALAFARNGYHVTVIDKRPVPKKLKPHYHMTLSGRAQECLAKMGVKLPPGSHTRGKIISWYPQGGYIDKSMYDRKSVHIDTVALS